MAKISLRSTAVVTNDNIFIIVPNTDLITQPIPNWSHGDPKVRIRLPIGVAYGTDMEMLKAVLLEVATEHPSVLPDPAPAVHFIDFGESSLDFELGAWTQEMAHAPRRFRGEINYAIARKSRENGIEIPYPQRVIHRRSTTP
ncbi:MAG: mechanosensitive ion channel [Opitutaceae bacterium]|nr:mechanosensitive ion channel [Opitutaceae bacterium]